MKMITKGATTAYKLARNPVVQQVAREAGNFALQAAKGYLSRRKSNPRRRARYGAGRRGGGRRAPTANRRLRVPMQTRTVYPATIGTSTRTSVAPEQEVQKTELALTVYGDATMNFPEVIPLAPASQYFPQLATVASTYQYYRFWQLMVRYEAVAGTSSKGQIAMAVVPTYAAAHAVRDWDSLTAIPGCRVCSVYESNTLPVNGQRDLLRTYWNQGWKVTTQASTNYQDETANQGFLLVGANNCSDASNVIVGNVRVMYDVGLMRPCMPQTALSMTLGLATTDGSSIAKILEAWDAQQSGSYFTTDEMPPCLELQDNGNGYLKIVGRSKDRWRMMVAAVATSDITFVVNTEVNVTEVAEHYIHIAPTVSGPALLFSSVLEPTANDWEAVCGFNTIANVRNLFIHFVRLSPDEGTIVSA